MAGKVIHTRTQYFDKHHDTTSSHCEMLRTLRSPLGDAYILHHLTSAEISVLPHRATVLSRFYGGHDKCLLGQLDFDCFK